VKQESSKPLRNSKKRRRDRNCRHRPTGRKYIYIYYYVYFAYEFGWNIYDSHGRRVGIVRQSSILSVSRVLPRPSSSFFQTSSARTESLSTFELSTCAMGRHVRAERNGRAYRATPRQARARSANPKHLRKNAFPINVIYLRQAVRNVFITTVFGREFGQSTCA